MNFKEEIDHCKHHTYIITELNSNPFTIALSHSGYKFLKVYKLKLTFVELLTYLISIPCFLLGFNLFKFIKLCWIKLLVE